MDPEIQEVPVASAAADPDVVVIDSSAEEAAATAAGASAAATDVDMDAPKAAQNALPEKRDDPLEDMEKALENACETLASFAANVMNFTYESQDLIFSNANEFVKDLKEIDRLAQNVTARIPVEVIEAIDKGKNPEQCTYQMLESCAEANSVSRGKLQAMRMFRDALEQSLSETEPKASAKADGDAEPDGSGVQLPSDGIGVSAGNAATNGF